MFRLIICGFDFLQTESRIDKFIKGKTDISVVYVDDEIRRKDNMLCHIVVGNDSICPYILKNQADYIWARTPNDAGRYIRWLKDAGSVRIEVCRARMEGERYAQEDMLDYLKKLAECGTIGKLIYGS